MEWLNSDSPGDESPYCSCCDRQIGVGVDAIALRVGSVKGDGSSFCFTPDDFDDGKDVRWFHFSCLDLLFDFAESDQEADITDCGFCPEDLIGEEKCYEMELGRFVIRGPDTWWQEVRDNDGVCARVCACTECLEHNIGEGNESELRRRLGMPERPLWVAGREKSVPAHLRRRGRVPPPRT